MNRKTKNRKLYTIKQDYIVRAIKDKNDLLVELRWKRPFYVTKNPEVTHADINTLSGICDGSTFITNFECLFVCHGTRTAEITKFAIESKTNSQISGLMMDGDKLFMSDHTEVCSNEESMGLLYAHVIQPTRSIAPHGDWINLHHHKAVYAALRKTQLAGCYDVVIYIENLCKLIDTSDAYKFMTGYGGSTFSIEMTLQKPTNHLKHWMGRLQAKENAEHHDLSQNLIANIPKNKMSKDDRLMENKFGFSQIKPLSLHNTGYSSSSSDHSSSSSDDEPYISQLDEKMEQLKKLNYQMAGEQRRENLLRNENVTPNNRFIGPIIPDKESCDICNYNKSIKPVQFSYAQLVGKIGYGFQEPMLMVCPIHEPALFYDNDTSSLRERHPELDWSDEESLDKIIDDEGLIDNNQLLQNIGPDRVPQIEVHNPEKDFGNAHEPQEINQDGLQEANKDDAQVVELSEISNDEYLRLSLLVGNDDQ